MATDDVRLRRTVIEVCKKKAMTAGCGETHGKRVCIRYVYGAGYRSFAVRAYIRRLRRQIEQRQNGSEKG